MTLSRSRIVPVLVSVAVLIGAVIFATALHVYSENARYQPRDVSDRQAAIALDVALSKVGAHYIWGSRGPDTFDSSGIILYAYQQAIPRMKLRVGGVWIPEYSENGTHRDFYRWNFRPVPPNELRPGDLVYITTGDAVVTHGMMFIRWIEDGRLMEVLDASSRLLKVSRQEWPLDEEVRGQRLVAVGRLQITPREDEWLRHEPGDP